jgi:tetratricopeptide (TPR) repeat protein
MMSDEVAAADNGDSEASIFIKRRRRRFSIVPFRRRLPCDNTALVDDKVRIESQITKLVSEMRILEARRLVLAAIAADGKTSFLLRRLAEIEELLGNYDSTVRYLSNALTLTPEDPEVIREHASALYLAGQYSEAKKAIDRLAPYQRQSPQIRLILGATYQAIGWPAHAVEAYGSVFRLPWRSASSWLVSWLACGAPIGIRRSDAWTFECMVEDHYIEESIKRRDFFAGLHFPSESEGRARH